MFDIKPDSRLSEEGKILYNIWEELHKLNASQNAVNNPQTNIERGYICKASGCSFKTENKGVYLAHCRQHKKEGV